MGKSKEKDFERFQASWNENKENIINGCRTTSSDEQQFGKSVMREYLLMKEGYGVNSPYEKKHLLLLEAELGTREDLTLKGIDKIKAAFSDKMNAKRVELIKRKIENTYGETAFLNKVEKIPKYDSGKISVEEDPVYANGGTLEINQKRQEQYVAGIKYADLVEEFTKGTLDLNRIANLESPEREALEKLDHTFGDDFLAKNMFPLTDEYCKNCVLEKKSEISKIQPIKEENNCASLNNILAEIAREKENEKATRGEQGLDRGAVGVDSMGMSLNINQSTECLQK